MTDNAKNDARIAGGVSPVPAGYTTLTPFLVVAGAARAIDFYCLVFGAAVVSRTDGPDGSVPHAELDFGTGRLQLGDPMPAQGLIAPEPSTVVSHSTMIYCASVDDVFQRAVKAGATVIADPATFVTGDRFGVMIDPFGHRWAIMTRVEDVHHRTGHASRDPALPEALHRPRGASASGIRSQRQRLARLVVSLTAI